MRLMKKSWIQVLISIMLTSLMLIGFFGKEVHAESEKELISSGILADEFEIVIDEGVYLKGLKPKYENNVLSFTGNLVNNTEKVVEVRLSGKLILDATKEEIGLTFENEAGAHSTIENVSIKTEKELPGLDLNQGVKRVLMLDYKIIENADNKYSDVRKSELVEKEEVNFAKDFFIIAIPTVCLIVSYSVWSAFGKDKKIAKKETHYPLKDLNSLEIAYLYQDKCDKNDIASLIIYLANAGFISIEETDLKDGHKNKIYKLKKLKEYNLKDENEKLLMETIFKDKKEITTDSLGNSLSDIKKEIKANMKYKYSDEKMYTKGEIIRKVYVSILIVISVLVIMIVPKLGITEKLFGIREIIMLLVLLLLGIMPAFLDIKTKRAENVELYTYMAIDVLLTVVFMYFIRGAFVVNRHFYEAIVAGSFVVVMMLLSYLMPKKIEKYAEKYQRISEFKEFMKNGNESSLKKLLKEDNIYFYNILPYATSLEVDKEWIAKSNGLVKTWPKWYKKKDENFETEILSRKYRKLIETLEFYADHN